MLLASEPGGAQDHRGYGPWRLGMSRDAVRAIAAYGPYTDGVSGGLETRNGLFEEQRTPVSFSFGQGTLSRIEIRPYEGQSRDAAIDAWYRVHQYLSRVHGAVESGELQVPPTVSREDFTAAARDLLDDKPESSLARLQFAPATRPPGVSVIALLLRDPQQGYSVTLSYQDF
jgi:hypothetical protein